MRWILFLICLMAAVLAFRRIDVAAPKTTDPPDLAIRFLDVGKGDAVLIQTGDGRAALYDGGDGNLRVLPLLSQFGVDSLELVIASHHHGDHTGGLPAVMHRYRPRFIMENGIPERSWAYEPFIRAAASLPGARLLPARRTVSLGDVQLHVLPPPGNASWGQNDNSIGLIVEFGGFRASLLGDSEHRQQDWWLAHHGDLLGDVVLHKASHHGSIRGDSWLMIARLRPEIVVMDSGPRNGRVPPDSLAVSHYRATGAQLYQTSSHGTVSILVRRNGAYEVQTENSAPFSAPLRE